MKILDRYILKKFFLTTTFIVVIFTAIAVVIDSSEKADDFVKTGLSWQYIAREYFLGFIAFIISMILPLMVFIAVIFFTSQMAGRSEIVAILASGVRFNRMLRPYIAGATIIAVLFWVATQFWIPKANVMRGDFLAKYVDSDNSYERSQYYGKGSNYYIRIDANTFAGLRSYDTTTKTAHNGFFLDRLKGTQVIYNLRGDYLKWDTARKKWTLENAVERKIDGIHETMRTIPSMDIQLNVQPSEIKPDRYLKDKLTSPELSRFITAEEQRGSEGLNDYKVELYRRSATPVSIILLTLIGVVVSSRKTRGGSGLNLAVGIITAALFVVMDKFSLTFSTKGNFPPLLAAWTPNIIFSFVAIWLYRLAPK